MSLNPVKPLVASLTPSWGLDGNVQGEVKWENAETVIVEYGTIDPVQAADSPPGADQQAGQSEITDADLDGLANPGREQTSSANPAPQEPSISIQARDLFGEGRTSVFPRLRLARLQKSISNRQRAILVKSRGQFALLPLPRRKQPLWLPPITEPVASSTRRATRASFSIRNPNPYPMPLRVLRRPGGLSGGVWEVVNSLLTVPALSSRTFEDLGSTIGTQEYALLTPDNAMTTIKAPGSMLLREARLGKEDHSSLRTPPKAIFVQDSVRTRILLNGITEDVWAVQVYRSNGTLVGEGQGDSINLEDRQATVTGRTYRYRFVLLGTQGQRTEFTDSFLRFPTLGTRPFGLNLELRDSSANTTNLRVNLRLSEQGIEEFVELLPRDFVEDYASDKERLRADLSEFLFYEVTRCDWRSGELETLGIFPVSQRNVAVSVTSRSTWIVTPIILSPIALLESSQTDERPEDGLSPESLRFRRFFSQLPRGWNALPSRTRVLNDPIVQVDYLLAAKDEKAIGKIAFQRTVSNTEETLPQPNLLSSSFVEDIRRVGALTEDVVVSWEFDEIPRNGYLIELIGEDSQGNQTNNVRRFYAESKSGTTTIVAPPFKPASVEVRPL